MPQICPGCRQPLPESVFSQCRRCYVTLEDFAQQLARARAQVSAPHGTRGHAQGAAPETAKTPAPEATRA